MFPFLGIEPLMFPKAPNVSKIFLALVEILGAYWCILKTISTNISVKKSVLKITDKKYRNCFQIPALCACVLFFVK